MKSTSKQNCKKEKEDAAGVGIIALSDDKSSLFDLTTKDGFQSYRNHLLERIPTEVKSRFREGGFGRWEKVWLPVLELGPFDVAPGPIRDMWLDMLVKVSLAVLSCMINCHIQYSYYH